MTLKIYDAISGKEINKNVEQIKVLCGGPCINGHYMHKEILQQAETIKKSSQQEDAKLIEAAMEILRAKNVIFTACGTARYASIVGRYVLSKVARKFAEVVMAHEFQYFMDSVDNNTLIIAVSQSGETADVLEGVMKAKEKGAKIIAVTNVATSHLARVSDIVFDTNCGPEIAVASTKAFTGQLAVLYMIAYAAANRMQEAELELEAISKKIPEILAENEALLKDLAEKFKGKRHFYYIAKGIDFAIASEGALKLKELSYIHAEGMPAGELKHGTISLIEKGTPLVVVCPKDYTFDETLSNAREAKSRGAYVIAVSDEHRDLYDAWIKIPKVGELFYPLVSVIPLQLFAYYMAVACGKNPDKPRNLAKSVTVK
ncbi:MAG: isomerizing glutamine--fructose-6-phosphate transaminase [Candidatus Aenigmarchaeota archaeon]|nr:isomerizing glutamine--fructose-6-phosphate transaminase [Candidatus Aenigmarchaeota archaeon]